MTQYELRWHQRLDNYESALKQLTSAVALSTTRALSELEKQGLIQAFEFTHELAWNVMKDYFFYQGKSDITGSRDATREAYSKGLIEDGERWMEMIKSRNQTSHTYNQRIADDIVEHITAIYHQCFKQFLEKMKYLRRHA
ncbi:MAG: nucleotidyltransferase [Legionella sp.]|jgi:nucleotidyltransferase substrate binding protein (TIGR01987 family)|nr:nucleotidyltransferase [Legionella sp.]